MSEGKGRQWTEAPGGERETPAARPGGATRARAASIALAVALASGCGTVCDEAAEHIDECGYHGGGASSEASCAGASRCASACAAEAPCGAFDGTDPAAFDKYMRCLDAC
ncbi:hypothetical protein WMF31_15955 [Sorangium sp. So ce1036]|uniref:hypothetical protein n=1 Tax=Sorangium sp. So ce1036 TaxID=3133328 RepID=UPI003EFCE118